MKNEERTAGDFDLVRTVEFLLQNPGGDSYVSLMKIVSANAQPGCNGYAKEPKSRQEGDLRPSPDPFRLRCRTGHRSFLLPRSAVAAAACVDVLRCDPDGFCIAS